MKTDNQDFACETMRKLLKKIGAESEKEPILPDRMVALSEAISALIPLVHDIW